MFPQIAAVGVLTSSEGVKDHRDMGGRKRLTLHDFVQILSFKMLPLIQMFITRLKQRV